MRFRFCLRIRWQIHHFRDGPQSDFHSINKRQLRQISPDMNVNFRYTTAAFTLSPESRGLLCGAIDLKKKILENWPILVFR